ncbi:MAG: glycosyltransferase family 39 protein [Acidobacteria bacterium]|nr:glycosyltransferase family 39 protein [Acidobacteriota bacterium]
MDNSASLANQSTGNSVGIKVQQFICGLLAIACLIWSLTDSRFRDAEGFVRGGVCLPIATAVALGLLSYALGKAWRTAAVWLAVALVGQAAALQMIEAGQHIKYQHYRPLGVLLASSPWLLALLALQTVAVLIGFRGRWGQVKSWFSRNYKFWQLAGLALVFFITTATVSREVRLYVQELPLAAFIQTINLLNLILAVWSIPESTLTAWRSRVERITGWEGNEESRIDRFAVTAAIGSTVLAVLLSFFSYQRHPHLGDEVAYLYHARYLATGVLTMPTPTPLEAFDLDLFDHDAARWYCSPPVGWPLVLALGVLVNADWLVNPLLGGICVLLAFLLVKELYDRRTARLTALLLALSPWHALVGMSYMTHSVALAFALLAAVAAAWARKNGNIFWALLSGVATGMVGMIRPLEGAIVGGLIGLWIIGVGGKRLKIPGLAAWALGCGIIGAAIFYYNFVLTGSPTKFPIMVWADKYMGVNSNAMGFGPDRGNGWPIDPYPGHSPLEGVINSNLNITAINTELFGWATGSLILIALLCLSLKLRGSDWKMMALIAAVFTAHFFYWFSGGPDFAARYWYLMIVPCVVLSVRGLQVLINRLTDQERQPHLPRTRALVAVLSLSLMALVNFTPWRAIDKYHHYNQMRPDVLRLAKEHSFGKSLILIRGEQFPDFASAAIYNPIDLKADAPVYAWDENPNLRNEVLKLYSDRPVWIVNGPSLTKAGFQIVEGPLSAQTLLERQQTASR